MQIDEHIWNGVTFNEFSEFVGHVCGSGVNVAVEYSNLKKEQLCYVDY